MEASARQLPQREVANPGVTEVVARRVEQDPNVLSVRELFSGGMGHQMAGTLAIGLGYGDHPVAAAEAFAKIIAGAELDIPPMAALKNVYLIPGPNGVKTPAVSAHVMVAITRVEGWQWAVEHSNPHGGHCKVTAWRGEQRDSSTWTTETAITAGLLTRGANGQLTGRTPAWQKTPHDMLYCRAASEVARRISVRLYGIAATEEMDDSGDHHRLPDPPRAEARPPTASAVFRRRPATTTENAAQPADGGPSSPPPGPVPREADQRATSEQDATASSDGDCNAPVTAGQPTNTQPPTAPAAVGPATNQAVVDTLVAAARKGTRALSTCWWKELDEATRNALNPVYGQLGDGKLSLAQIAEQADRDAAKPAPPPPETAAPRWPDLVTQAKAVLGGERAAAELWLKKEASRLCNKTWTQLTDDDRQKLAEHIAAQVGQHGGTEGVA